MKLLLVFAFVAVASAKFDPLSDEFIGHLNAQKSTWKAGRNFAADTSKEYLRGLMGVLPGKTTKDSPVNRKGLIPEGFQLPESFDSRDEWPHCPTIAEIRDQGECGSCWAVGAVSVMSDRHCILSEGKEQVRYSSENMVACCWLCGFGCNGGWLSPAFEWWRDEGVVSGGRYNSNEGCQPYTFRECEHHMDGDRPICSGSGPTPDCSDQCIAEFDGTYEEDLHYASEMYTFYLEEEETMMDIMTNGPVEASFDVYEDFVHYKSGVYQHLEGELLGGHAIRIIGWGVDDGTPYWLIANSWNYDWGEEGYFRILRGSNECGIEGNIVTGKPKLQ